MTKLFLLLLFTWGTCSMANGQILNFDTLSNYTKSTVLRVYDVAAKVPLTVEEQLSLANLFEAENEELIDGLLNGKSSSWADSVRAGYQNTFNALLPTNKRDLYYQTKILERSEVMSALTAQMLKRKYNSDDAMEQHFQTIYKWRESIIEKIWLTTTDKDIRNENLLYTLTVYDTLISRYIMASEGSQFLARRIYAADSLIGIDSTRKDALMRAFIANCLSYKSLGYGDNFDKAFTNTFNNFSDTSYYAIIYNEDILKQTALATTTSMASYVKQDRLSAYTINEIIPLISGREREVAIINKIFPDYTQAKDSIINLVFEKYQPQIDSIIGYDARLYNLSQIEVAIRFANELDITTQQMTDLQEALSELRMFQEQYHQEDPLGEYDSRAFESETLNTVLTPEQYTEVLITKFQGKALSWAKFDWIAMNEAGIAVNFDSASTNLELYNYHLAILVAYYRNGNNAEEQFLSVSRINQIMPIPKRELLELWEYLTPYSDLPDAFFQW